MKKASDLRRQLHRLDRKPYGYYRDLKGGYDFKAYILKIDYVQPDPFAPPSQIAVRVPAETAGFPENLFNTPVRRRALEDCLTRYFFREAGKITKGNRGTGRSGLVSIDQPSQEVLTRTAMVVAFEYVEARFVVGLPARGERSSAARPKRFSSKKSLNWSPGR